MRRSRGVEPIVAAIILIIAAVIAGVLVWMWLSGYVTGTTQAVPSAAQLESLKPEHTYCDSSNIVIYLSNIGGSAVTVTHAYVWGGPSGQISGAKQVNIGVTIGPTEVQSITISAEKVLGNGTFSKGYTYYVKLVTAKRTEVVVSCTVS